MPEQLFALPEPPASPASPAPPRPAEPPHRTGPPEAIGYAVAALVLVVGGALFTTPVLNWLVGPAICVLCVATAGHLADRRSDPS
ncbi:hypothetical protein [Streptomyces hainanensis]|uniref:Uncharacterized protein n=1 Tax=Streptomyces hainanensis TaxID=402648 RepID=A0A4V2Y426_9ACTN|nr:hypothetical protein [Streptomyces hainanensis]TDC78735.1 hypothetical protein E1283_04530 [Streptomyces hainanensis]